MVVYCSFFLFHLFISLDLEKSAPAPPPPSHKILMQLRPCLMCAFLGISGSTFLLNVFPVLVSYGDHIQEVKLIIMKCTKIYVLVKKNITENTTENYRKQPSMHYIKYLTQPNQDYILNI